jgi:type II secretory pathway component PulK
VRDLEARFNLNQLVSKTPLIPAALLTALVASTGAPVEITGILEARYAPFQPAAGTVASPQAEASFQSGDMTHIAEIATLLGSLAREALPLLDHLAMLPRARPINVNTAAGEVLMAATGLDKAAVALLITQRGQSPFPSVSAFRTAVSALAGEEAAAILPFDLLGVNSQWFAVETEVSVGGLTHRSQTILLRDPERRTIEVFARVTEVTG